MHVYSCIAWLGSLLWPLGQLPAQKSATSGQRSSSWEISRPARGDGPHGLLDWPSVSSKGDTIALIGGVRDTLGKTTGLLVRMPGGTLSLKETQCSVVAEPARTIRLADGRPVGIDVTTAATSGNALLLLGGNVVVDGRAAGNVIGVLRSELGTIHPVLSPFDSIRPSVTLAARANSERWHVILVTGAQGISSDALAYGNAAIWYAQVDSRGGWHGLTQIAMAQDARFGFGLQSDLQVTPDGVALAYAFDRSYFRKSNADGNQGIVLIRQANKMWKFDTLRTWSGPNAVQLAITPTGSYQALFTSRVFQNRRVYGPYLNQAIFNAMWTTTTTLVRPVDSSPSIRFPLQSSRPGALPFVLWRESIRPQLADRIFIGLVSADSIQVISDQVGVIPASDRPAMIVDSTLGAFIFSRAGKEDSTIRVTLATQTHARLIGTINERIDAPAIYAVNGKSGRIDLVVGRVDERGRSATMIISIAVHCGGNPPVE